MTQWGLTPWGTGAFGGPGQITIRGGFAVGPRQILVDFDVPPLVARFRTGSAVRGENWSIAARAEATDLTPPIVPTVLGGSTGPVDHQVLLTTDVAIPTGYVFVVTGHSIRGAACEHQAGDESFEVEAPRPSQRKPETQLELDTYRDLDWREERLRTTPAGDWAVQSGAQSLRQRLFRRITTAFGAFVFFDQAYGVRLRISQLITARSVQEMATEITEHVRREPDVLEATATVSLVGSVVVVEIYARSRYSQDVRTQFRFDEAQR